MKKILYISGGILLLIGMSVFIYFYNIPLHIKNIEQTSVASGSDELFFEKVNVDIELSKEVAGISSILIKDDIDQELVCPIITNLGKRLQISLENAFFKNDNYQVIGYMLGDEKMYFKTPVNFDVRAIDPFKVSEFTILDDDEKTDGDIVLEFKIYNPLKVSINKVHLNIGTTVNIFEQDDFIIFEDEDIYYQLLTINIPINMQTSDYIQLTSFDITYQELTTEHIPENDLIGYINIYKDIEVIDVVTPDYIFYENKGFFIKVLLTEKQDQTINSFLVVLGNNEIEVKIDQMNIHDEYNEYSIYLPNPKQQDVLELSLVGIRVNGKIYKVSSLFISLEVRNALDNCFLKSKSANVMTGTRLAFYIECESINQGVNLYKFSGTFNGVPFKGYNYISYPQEFQESENFSFVDIHHNIISIMTLPVESLEDKKYCSFEINKLYYFFDNQENVYELNQTLWVIPEEVVIVVKDFYMEKAQYNVTEEIPKATLELLISSSITIDKIILDVNGMLIENVFTNGGASQDCGTYLFNLLAYKPSTEQEFIVKIFSIELNGQGTKLIKNDFDNIITFETSP